MIPELACVDWQHNSHAIFVRSVKAETGPVIRNSPRRIQWYSDPNNSRGNEAGGGNGMTGVFKECPSVF